jgi:hypothetical protein
LIHRSGSRIAAAAFLLVCFVFFCWDAVAVHFAPDDMMNMASYLRMKPIQLLVTQFVPWQGPYRPLAALYYVPLRAVFGLNPAPYHVVLLIVLLANVYLVYRFARLLGAGELAAAGAALLVCYHAGLAVLWYETSFVFDVLCSFFYLAALVWYLRIRDRGQLPNGRQIAALSGLYLCALNSKEMAVTLPLMLAAYEWVYHKFPRTWGAAGAWLRGAGRGALATLAITLPYLYGKTLRHNALIENPGYHPVISAERVLKFQIESWSDILQVWNALGLRSVVALWVILTYVAWRRNRPVLRFCWFFFLITPLPIEFLPGRTGACLAIPYCGLAVFTAVVFVDAARHAARFLVREPAFRGFRPDMVFAAICTLGVLLWAQQNYQVKQAYVKPAMNELGTVTSSVIGQLRELQPQVRPHSRVVFENDPFTGWDMLFIAEAWFRDRTLDYRLTRKTPLSAEELAHADYVFTFVNGRLKQSR